MKKVSREYRYLHGTGTVIKSTVVVPWYRQYRPLNSIYSLAGSSNTNALSRNGESIQLLECGRSYCLQCSYMLIMVQTSC